MPAQVAGKPEKEAPDIFFAHHAWATLRVIAACHTLTGDQLDHSDPGAYGSIRLTLAHMIRSEERYLTFLTGRDFTSAPQIDEQTDLAEIEERARRSGEALRGLALHLEPGSLVRLGEGEQVEWMPASVVLLQALYHAHEHRTQINSLLGQLGIAPPPISGWEYYDQVLAPH